MFQGTTIEELINSVRRAEQHAREEQELAAVMPEVWQQQAQSQQLSEVA